MSKQATVAKNSVYNIFGSFLPTVVTLITVPLYISQIGEARYGVLALVWLILGYFGLFDLGLGKAVANQIAFFRESKGTELDEDGKIFWTAFQINLLLGMVGGLILYVAGPWVLIQIADTQDELIKETLAIFPIFAMAVPVVTISSVGTGFFEGKEQFGIINILQVITNILFQLFPLLTAFFINVSLFHLITAAVVAKLSSTLILFLVLKIKSKIGRFTFSREKVKQLITYGGAITVSNIISPILTSIDRFLIGAVVGAKAVTYYTIPYNLSVKINHITGSYSRALFPKFSMLSEKESKDLAVGALTFLLLFITPIIIVGFLIMDPFLTIWIGDDLATNSSPVGYIILMGVWINTLAFIPVTFLTGQRKPGIVALVHSLELLPYLGILWFLISHWGVEGAAFAWSIRVAVDAMFMFGYAKLYKKLWVSISGISLIVVTCFLLTFYSIPYHKYILVMFIICFLLYGFIYYKAQYLKVIRTIKTYVVK